MIKKFLKEKLGIEADVYIPERSLYLSHWKSDLHFYVGLDFRRIGFCFEVYIAKPGHILISVPFLSISFEW